MAMSQREKYLGIGVGIVAALFGMQYVVNGIRAGIDQREASITRLKEDLSGLEGIQLKGMIDGKKLDQMKVRSLPSSREKAVAQYKNWLSELAQQCKLENIQLDVSGETKIKKGTSNAAADDIFTLHQFKLSARGRIDNIIKLLGMYYDQNYLHRIRGLKINFDGDNLDFANIQMTSEALAMMRAPGDQKPSTESSGRLAKSIADYQASILGRNPFAPPNEAPRLSIASSVDVPRGRDWSLELKATDSNPAHQVRYDVLSDLPEGMRFDASSGRLSWSPKENGSYELLVRATDSGFPAKSSEQKVKLRVTDPPPPPAPTPEAPKFDPATQAFVSAMVNGNSGEQAWIRTKTDNSLVKVGVGDKIDIGTVKGTVTAVDVGKQFLEIDSEGRKWTLGMGDYLAPTFQKSRQD